MQIVTQVALNESDIKEAILAHIAAKGISTSGSASVELVHGDSLSAKVDISSDAGAGIPAATKPINQKAEDIDREAIKIELDALGIEYAPKAHTATLQDLLENAKVTPDDGEDTTPEAPAEDTSSLFGGGEQETTEEPSPFATETITEDKPDTEPEDVAEDDKPLFGA